MPSKIDIIASQRFQDGDLEILGIHVAKNSNRRVWASERLISILDEDAIIR